MQMHFKMHMHFKFLFNEPLNIFAYKLRVTWQTGKLLVDIYKQYMA